MNKRVIVCGAAGFIGQNLTRYLKEKNNFVIGIDVSDNLYANYCDEFYKCDLTDIKDIDHIFSQNIDCIYQLAANMGGAGYVFTGLNDANIMSNSVLINVNILKLAVKYKIEKVFFSSSACVYPDSNQLSDDTLTISEESAYPANPNSGYGWEKIFSERLYEAYARNYGIDTKIARFHNIYGPYACFDSGKEKALSAICRKVALANNNEEIEIWGNGLQKRSFLYIDDCVEAIYALTNSSVSGPVNIGSEQNISINDLTKLIAEVANKNIIIKNVEGPVGVNVRNSDNRLIKKLLNWEPKISLKDGVQKTYDWISAEIDKSLKN